jgi:formate/nitrite transporter FocA (FNT family)
MCYRARIDQEARVEAEEQQSELSDKDLVEADRRSSLSAKIVHEAIRLEGHEELERPSSSIGWSALAAGLTMGFSMVAEGILHSRLPDMPWRELVSSFGYCAGFLFVTMARQQLFTETTLTVMLPFLHGTHKGTEVLRFWIIVFAANILGSLLFAAAAGLPGLFEPDMQRAFAELGEKAAQPPFVAIALKGVVAGWLIALMVWLLPAAGPARFLIIVTVTYLIAIANLSHVIAGSAEVAFAAFRGTVSWGHYVVGFLVPALIGNTIGGVTLVALLNHAQVKEEL